jgi:hypothetical protein
MRARWHGARSFDPALPELRRRSSWLVRDLDPRSRALVLLLPLLLTARFRRPLLDREAPGLLLGPRRRRWGALCALLELPPPAAFTTSRPLVQSALLAPLGDGRFEVLVVPVADVPPGELPRLLGRVEFLQGLATRTGPRLEVRLAARAELTASLLPWVGVCAGSLPEFVKGPVDRLEVLVRAPTPLARCLALLVEDAAPPPEEVLLTRGRSARPEAFAARWSGHPAAQAALGIDRCSLGELEAAGAALRQACVGALRRFPVAHRRPLRALLRHELFSSPIPGVLRPALEALVRGRSATERVGPDGWTLEVDGVPVARGRTLDQLRAAAVTQTPILSRPDSPWGRVAQQLTSGNSRAVILVEAGDQSHLVVRLAGAGRLRATRLEAEGLLRFAMSARVRGLPSEVIAGLGSDQSLVTRLAQIGALPVKQDQRLGVEVGRRLLLADGHHVRSRPLATALSRPMALTWLPADPELLRSLRRHTTGSLPTVQVTAWPLASERAALYFVDANGTVLREEVAWAHLESHLVESRELLRLAARPSLLSVTVHPRLTALSGRRLDAELPPLPLDVESEWPFTIRVWLEGEPFCAPGDLGWTSLSEAVLSHWAPGTWGRVGVRSLSFITPPASSSPLFLLALRSRVLRRVAAGLRRLTRVMEAA